MSRSRKKERSPVSPVRDGFGRAGRLSWIALLGLLALSACQRERKDPFAQVPPMHFQVDETLLGPAVVDSSLRISFRPPAQFQPGHPDNVRLIREEVRRGQNPEDAMAAEPVLIFGRPDRPASLITVSRFLNPPPGGMSPEWIELSHKATRESVQPAEAKDDLFRLNDLLAVQYLVQNEQMVLFRLVLQGPNKGDPVRLDYLIPRPDYEEMVRGIESSIGSVTLF